MEKYYLEKKMKENEPVGMIPSDGEMHEKLKELIDEGTVEWMQQKTRAFFDLISYYRCAMMEVETKLNVLNEEYSMRYDRNPIMTIKSRIKSIDSIRGKLKRKGLPFTLDALADNIYDVAGLRVICAFREDVYSIAESLLSQDDVTLIRRTDYIENPKPNGYRSLHLIIEVPIFLASEKRKMKVEIQLRTVAMDWWASLEHQLRYKKDNVFTEAMSNELNYCAAVSAELDERMNKLMRAVDNGNGAENDNEVHNA